MSVKLPNKVPDKIGANMIHCITAFPAVKYSGRHRNDRLRSRDIQLSKYLRKGEKAESIYYQRNALYQSEFSMRNIKFTLTSNILVRMISSST